MFNSRMNNLRKHRQTSIGGYNNILRNVKQAKQGNGGTPETPTYALQSNTTVANEGTSVTFTLITTNVSNGTLVPYTITGIDSNDIGGASLTGTFTVNNNTSSASATIAEDLTTEGTETLTLTLDNGQASVSVTINDTSVEIPQTPLLACDFPAARDAADQTEVNQWLAGGTLTYSWNATIGNDTGGEDTVTGSNSITLPPNKQEFIYSSPSYGTGGHELQIGYISDGSGGYNLRWIFTIDYLFFGDWVPVSIENCSSGFCVYTVTSAIVKGRTYDAENEVCGTGSPFTGTINSFNLTFS